MRRSSIHKAIVLGLCTAGALLVSPAAWAQQGDKDAVQVPPGKLQEWVSRGFSYAGVSHQYGCTFLNTGPASDRRQFSYCANGDSNTYKGSQRVEGDMICSKWPWSVGEQCVVWFQIGENKYQQRSKGHRTPSATVYVLD